MTTRQPVIAGVGYTAFSRASQRSVLDLAIEACSDAAADAGLPLAEVDGLASFQVMKDSVPCQSVATALALPQLRLALDLDMGGQAPCYLVGLASAMVASGTVDNVVVFRALNGRSGPRVGAMEFAGPAAQYRYPIGYGHYAMYVAMWANRFLAETGQDTLDLAAVAMTQRKFAALNERAIRRGPLDLDAYLAEPGVVDPFRVSDCTAEVDGACAVLVTTTERARDLRQAPVAVGAACYRAGVRSGLDIGDHLLWDDYTRNYTSLLRDELYGRAGVGPADIDLAEIYDCFSSTVLIGLEGLGLCDRGESGALVRSGATGPGGRLPVNTHGGLLSEGYLHGMNTVAEAVLQIQGRGGERQSSRHEVAAVTSGALMDGSALILTQLR